MKKASMNLINLLKVIFVRRLYVFSIISLGFLGVTFVLAVKLSPWLYAMNVPVKLYMLAPAQKSIHVCWDQARRECLPLVPYVTEKHRIAARNEIADAWLSELPPRPSYTISLVFQSPIERGTFRYLEMDSSKTYLWGFIPGAGIRNMKITVEQFTGKHIAYQTQGDAYSVDVSGYVTANKVIKPGPAAVSKWMAALTIWGLLFSAYLLFAIPLYLFPFSVQNLASMTKNDRFAHYSWWSYLLCGIAILLMLIVTLNVPIMFSLSDQIPYLNEAVKQAWFINAARPPGYTLFVSLMLWLFDYHINGIVLWQVIFFAVSTTICIWALRKWLHPLVAVLVMVGILFSPTQLQWMLSILRESIFVSLILLGVAAVICHFTTPNPVAARIWLAIFAIICGLGLLVRENGISLPVMLLPTLLPEALRRWKSSETAWKGAKSVFLLFIRYAAPVACVCIVYFGLSTYNYFNYGYFQFTRHATSHHFLWSQITTANFDSRSLLKPDRAMKEDTKKYLRPALYNAFIAERVETPGHDPIYTTLFPSIWKIMPQKSQSEFQTRLHAASIVDDIGRSASTLLPWQANLIGAIRQYREFILSNPYDLGGHILILDDAAGLSYKQGLLQGPSRKLKYDGVPLSSDSILNKFYDSVADYRWYHPLFFIALLFSLYLLRYDTPVLLAPIALFMTNAILMIAVRMEYFRFIQCMDVLLVLQVGLGLSSWIYRHFSPALKRLQAQRHENIS